VTGSPISDINPLYMAAGAVFTIAAEGSPTREVLRPAPARRIALCLRPRTALPWL